MFENGTSQWKEFVKLVKRNLYCLYIHTTKEKIDIVYTTEYKYKCSYTFVHSMVYKSHWRTNKSAYIDWEANKKSHYLPWVNDNVNEIGMSFVVWLFYLLFTTTNTCCVKTIANNTDWNMVEWKRVEKIIIFTRLYNPFCDVQFPQIVCVSIFL